MRVPDTVGPEQLVGELGIFDGLPRSTTAIAVEPVGALSLERSDLVEALAQSPRWRWRSCARSRCASAMRTRC